MAVCWHFLPYIRGMTSPGPQAHLNICLETALCIPNPLMLCPACSYRPGACAPLLLPREIAVLAREL